MNTAYEYRYNDRDDLINKNFLFNKAVNKLKKKYPQIHPVRVSFKNNEQQQTIKLCDSNLRKYPEEVRKELTFLFLKVYGEI